MGSDPAPKPRVSWIILTYNRGAVVRQSVKHNFDTAGVAPDELIWVDNGSTDVITRDFMSGLDPEVSILNNENLGVAKGYNRGLGLATGDYIVITGCDMLMPNNWLGIMLDYVTGIPDTGVACVYSRSLASCQERVHGLRRVVNGLPIIPALPIERRIFRRELLADFGYFPESFGLYGMDDLAWAQRAERVCAEKGLLSYVIPDMQAEHLGTEGVSRYDGKDEAAYHAMKKREASEHGKIIELARLRGLGWPRFTPYL